LLADLKTPYSCSYRGESISIVYVFEATVVKYARNRYVIYPPKEYQEKLKKLYGEKVKVIVIKESD
jgi:hypothetical protein